MVAEIDFKSKEFRALCKKHQVKELFLFGSMYHRNHNMDSDIDLLVNIDEKDPVKFGRLFLSLYIKLEKLFSKKVDLLTIESIRNHLFEEHILSHKELIYDGSQRETL